ncbi:MAG TPA: DUF456 domain-containing protein [Acidimicrobiia bacterium]|nr:DUF456 domain-containing protein [Acidimicrobiia bacterium]
MDAIGEFIIGLLILAGLVGILLPVLPGLLLEVGAVILWAGLTGGAWAWSLVAAAVVLTLVSQVFKYMIPGRRLRDAGIPRSTLYLAGALAIAGFFVIPVIGAPIGFVGGTYLAERQRLGHDLAWPSTTASLRAVGLAIGIELTAGLFIAGAWLVTVIWLT